MKLTHRHRESNRRLARSIERLPSLETPIQCATDFGVHWIVTLLCAQCTRETVQGTVRVTAA